MALFAKYYTSFNINLLKKRFCILGPTYKFNIYRLSKPLKVSRHNLGKYLNTKKLRDIGVVINKEAGLDFKNNNVLFTQKRLFSKDDYSLGYIFLEKSKSYSYNFWLNKIEKQVLALCPKGFFIPLNQELDLYDLDVCTIYTATLSKLLFNYFNSGEVVLCQSEEDISIIAYIIQSMDNSQAVKLCINLDFMLARHSVEEIQFLLTKFDIKNHLKFIKTNKLSIDEVSVLLGNSSFFNDIIVFGEGI